MNGDGENRRVRCGWMYYACFFPVCGLLWSKTPLYRLVKKSAIFYDGRILGKSGNNHYFPGYISHLDTFIKVSSQDTHTYLLPTILSFYNNSNILFDIYSYHIWYTVFISRTYRHICTLYADVITNAYSYGGNGQFAISKKVLPNVCFQRYTIVTRWGNGKQPEPTAPIQQKAGDINKAHSAAATVLHARHKRQCSLMYIGSTA